MATAQFAFVSVADSVDRAVYNVGATVESETVSGSNAATAAAASATQNFCRVATDTAAYVSFGAAPNAGTDTIRFLCPANSVSFFRVSSGDKGAVIALG
jgi:hypothetical protein